MREQIDILSISQVLKRYGYTQEALDEMSEKELYQTYKKETTERITESKKLIQDQISVGGVAPDVIDTPTHSAKEILESKLKDKTPLIEILVDMLYKYEYADIKNALANVIKARSNYAPQKILDLAYREYQELLLYDISNLLHGIPKEEFKVIMDHYEYYRRDISKLREAISILSVPEKLSDIVKMTKLKNTIIRNYMPNTLQDVYKQYYNSMPEKLAMVEEIMSYTNIYSRDYLRAMYMDDLESMRDEFRAKKEKEEREEKKFNRYAQALEDAFYNSEDTLFKDISFEAFRSLSAHQIVRLNDRFSSSSSFLINKFNSIYKEFKNMR